MIRGSSLVGMLDKVVGDGVVGAILLAHEGTLIAYSGLDEVTVRSTAAISSVIWNNIDRAGKLVMSGEPLKRFTMKCEDGYISVCPVSSLLLCIQSKVDVQLYSLMGKIDALRAALDGPLEKLDNI